MSSVLSMRLFVCDKLTVVAQEILAAFEKTLEGHEAEIVRQRKMLETFFSHEIKLQQTGRCAEKRAPTEQLVQFTGVSL